MPTGGSYNFAVNAGSEHTAEAAVNVDVAALSSLTLADTQSGGPSVNTTSSSMIPILYLNKPDSGAASFTITPAIAGSLGGGEQVDWKISGAGASATSGTLTGTSSTVSLDGSTSGNWTFTVTLWIDAKGDGALDAGDPEMQATVRVIQPVFTLTDNISGNQKSDDTNSALTPGGFLAVTDDSGIESTMGLSLTDELSSAPLPDVFKYDMETLSLTEEYSGDLPGATDLVTPPPGQYLVSVTDTADDSFDRYLQFDVMQFDIVWEGSTMTGVGGATEVSNGQVLSSASNINLLAGQQMYLGYQLYQGSPIVSDSVQWNVGNVGDFIKDFTLSGPPGAPTTDSIVPLTASDLTGNTVAGYCLVDSPGRTIGLTVTFSITGVGTLVFGTFTSISVQKPGASIWSGPSPAGPNMFSVTGSVTSGFMLGADLTGARATWQNYLPGPGAGFVGTVQWVQLANISYYESYGIWSHNTQTNGYELDTVYPYDFGAASSDAPDIDATGTKWTYLSLTLNAEDWLMWTAPGDAVPIPLRYFTWSCWAEASLVAGAWVPTFDFPTVGAPYSIRASPASTSPVSSGYPSWSNILIL